MADVWDGEITYDGSISSKIIDEHSFNILNEFMWSIIDDLHIFSSDSRTWQNTMISYTDDNTLYDEDDYEDE